MVQQRPTLYVFLDESGDFTFSRRGSPYFVLAAVTTESPLPISHALLDLKHELIESVHDREFSHFHALDDPRPVKLRVFGLLSSLTGYRVDAVSFPKNLIHPYLYHPWDFYSHAARLLFKFLFTQLQATSWNKIVVVMDRLKLQRDRRVVIHGVKAALKPLVGSHRYHVWMHESAAHPMLQVADYFSWAIGRGRNGGDWSYRNRMLAKISSDFLLYRRVTRPPYY